MDDLEELAAAIRTEELKNSLLLTDEEDETAEICEWNEDGTIIIPEGMTLSERFWTPVGYHRVSVTEGSFAAFLRSYPMKEDGSQVLYYNGKKTGTKNHAAVFAMHLEPYNLQ